MRPHRGGVVESVDRLEEIINKINKMIEKDDDDEEETSEDQRLRLAALITGDDDDDDDDDEEEEESVGKVVSQEKVRLEQLLRRGTSAASEDGEEEEEEAEHEDKEEMKEETEEEARKPVVTVLAPVAAPDMSKSSSGILLDRINTRLSAMQEGEDEVEEEELDFRPAENISKKESPTGDAASLRLRASRHDARAATEIVVEIVWENQCIDSIFTEGAKRLASLASSTLSPGTASPATWRPCRGNSRWGGDSKPSFESATQPRLGRAFSLQGTRPDTTTMSEAEQLPDTTWRWLSPWQLDSRVHGSDRLCLDEEDDRATPDDWLYANAWPTRPDQPYLRREQSDHKVRCRRWIRPRERLAANALLDTLLAETNEHSLTPVFLRRQNSATGLIDLDGLAADLGLSTPDETSLINSLDTNIKEEEEEDKMKHPAAIIPPPPPPSQADTAPTTKEIKESSHIFSRSNLSSSFSALLKTAQNAASSVSQTTPQLHSDPSSEAGVVLDFVWEQQRYAPSLRGQGSWTGRALLRRQPYEASRPDLVSLFKRYDGPPDPDADVLDSALPDGWRWISPWVIDSVSFGADRTLSDALNIDDNLDRGASNQIIDGWLYAFDWPASNHGYKPKPDNRCFVRCRRWVRPRERIPPGEEDRVTGGGRNPPPPPEHGDFSSPLASPSMPSPSVSSGPKLFS